MNRAAADSEQIDATAARWIARRDAGLTEEESGEFARWQEQDARHRAALARFEFAWTAVGQPRRLGASAALGREIGRLHRRRRTRALGTAGAALLVALAAGWWWHPHASPRTAAAESSIVVLMPEQRTLPDGSTVELKPGTPACWLLSLKKFVVLVGT